MIFDDILLQQNTAFQIQVRTSLSCTDKQRADISKNVCAIDYFYFHKTLQSSAME